MKKQKLKARVTQLLLQIHRGFMPDEAEGYSDAEILANIPEGLSPKENPDGETDSLVLKPFTYKWVAKRVKRNPSVTSYDMLVEAGFKDTDGS